MTRLSTCLTAALREYRAYGLTVVHSENEKGCALMDGERVIASWPDFISVPVLEIRSRAWAYLTEFRRL